MCDGGKEDAGGSKGLGSCGRGVTWDADMLGVIVWAELILRRGGILSGAMNLTAVGLGRASPLLAGRGRGVGGCLVVEFANGVCGSWRTATCGLSWF